MIKYTIVINDREIRGRPGGEVLVYTEGVETASPSEISDAGIISKAIVAAIGVLNSRGGEAVALEGDGMAATVAARIAEIERNSKP